MARGVRDAGADAVEVPVADGGDGTLDVLLAAGGSDSRVTRHRVTGPTGKPLTARLGWLGDDEVVVELAEASGLRRLDVNAFDALHATSRGTGELIRIALDAGARSIVVGVGGSACTDGGAGLIQALGGRLTDSRGNEIGPGGAGLEDVEAIELSAVRRALSQCSIEVACDIRSPLLGPQGAARMFAPQKGANAEDVMRLERALTHLAAVAAGMGGGDVAGISGAGAAGGCGFGLALAGARLVPGARAVCDRVGRSRGGRTDLHPEPVALAEYAREAFGAPESVLVVTGVARGALPGPPHRAVGRAHAEPARAVNRSSDSHHGAVTGRAWRRAAGDAEGEPDHWLLDPLHPWAGWPSATAGRQAVGGICVT